MSIDFNRLKHFSMTYVFIDDEDIACEYEQTEQNPVVAPDGNSVSFTLKNIDQDEDKECYSVVLVKESDDEFYIKSDYFDDAAEPYPLDVEISDDDVKFILEGEDEVMYLYGFSE
ncbi:hypothetical protein V3O24_16510 [Methylobacter sp. Wu8]|uniref:Uncharacterized protein n=2 Tax=Methylobacter tundripaludum TaxID=173365 RepID=A0A2S6H6S8_9GAMM|nr:hypothetical protein [Methylobacter tundripaludum]MCK9635034.1 hypothetical protein [Methylobacter tundripaludum]PPK73168.1 hypothetical protein B0F88_102147 [Methylobacter tundripaludum]